MRPSNQPDEPDGQGVSVSTLPAPAGLPQSATLPAWASTPNLDESPPCSDRMCDVAGLPISLTCGLASAQREFRTSILVTLLTRYAYAASHREEKDVRVARYVDTCMRSPTSYGKKIRGAAVLFVLGAVAGGRSSFGPHRI